MSQNDNNNHSSNRWGSNTRHLQADDARRAILCAAANCFADRGVHTTTMDDIAHAANITRRTVYHYFKSKREILGAAVEQQSCDFFAGMLASLPEEQGFCQQLLSAIVYILEHMPNDPFYRLQVSDKAGLQAGYLYFKSPQLHQLWVQAFKPSFFLAQTQGQIHADLSLEDILTWCGRVVLSHLQYPEANLTPQQTAANIERLFINAIRC